MKPSLLPEEAGCLSGLLRNIAPGLDVLDRDADHGLEEVRSAFSSLCRALEITNPIDHLRRQLGLG